MLGVGGKPIEPRKIEDPADSEAAIAARSEKERKQAEELTEAKLKYKEAMVEAYNTQSKLAHTHSDILSLQRRISGVLVKPPKSTTF